MGLFGLHLPKRVDQVFGSIGQGVSRGVHDVTHNPVTNLVGAVEKPVFHAVSQAPQYLNPVNDLGKVLSFTTPHIPTFTDSSPLRFANNALVNPVKTTGVHVGQGLQGQNPYHGSIGQQLGQAGQDVITLTQALPIGKGAEIALKAAPLVTRAAQGAKLGLKAGGGFGAAQGLSTSLQNKQNLPQTLKTIGINTAAGGLLGAGLGTALPIAASGAKVGGRVVVKAADNRVPLNQTGAVGKNVSNEAAQYAHAFNVTTDKAKQDLAQLNQAQNVAAAKQMIKPQGVGMSKEIKQQLNPRPAPTKNPMTPGPLDNKVGFAKVQEGDLAQPHLNAQFVHDKLIETGNIADQHVGALSPKDQELMKQIQVKGIKDVAPKADNPQQFTQAEAALRQYYDTRIAYDHLHGIKTPYRQNYLRDLIPDNSNSVTNRAATGGDKTPGYTLSKQNPGNTGVLEGLRRDVAGASFNHAKLAYAKGMEQAFPGQISRGSPIVGQEGVTKQLLTPYGEELFATKDLAAQINRRAPATKTKGAVKVYDTANSNLKYYKLGGGTFHAITEAGNIAGQQLMSGNLSKHPVDNLKLVAGTFSKTKHEANMRGYASDAAHYADGVPTLDRARIFGATLGERQILGDVHVSPGVTKVPVIHQIHEAIFKRQIPEAKLMAIKQLTQHLDIHNPADVAQGRAIAKAMNKLGGINRAVEGLTPQTAQKLSRAVLATDFTEGRWSTMIAAVSKAGPEGDIARQMVVGKTLVYLLPTLAAATIAGKIDWNNPKDVMAKIGDQILDPHFPTGFKTKTGIEKIAKTPETFVSEIGRLVKPIFNGSADKTAGLKHYAGARLAAAPSLVEQVATNQDYRGDPVIPRDSTGKINVKGAATNLAVNSAPIPISQGIKVAQGKQKVGEAFINTAGLRTVADPNSTQMKSLNNQNKVLSGLTKDDQAKYNDAHGIRTDQYGNKQNTVPAGNGAHNADIFLQDLVHGKGSITEAGAKIDAYNRKVGLPGDPFYDLNKDQQIAVLLMQQDKTRNPAESKNISNQNQDWLPGYYKNRTAYFDKLHLPKSAKIQELPEPFADKQTSKDLASMSNLSGTELGDFISSHSNVTDYFNKKSQWVNDNRTIEHRPELDTYPSFSPEVKQIQAEFSAVPKGGGKKGGNKYRADWIKANPQKYAELGQAFTQAAIYGLEQDAAQAQYKNSEFSQKGLKDIVNLAKYDISSTKDANGNTFYALGGSGGSGNSGYGSFASRQKTINPASYIKNISVKSAPKLARPVSVKKIAARPRGTTSGKIKVSYRKAAA